MGYLFKLIGFWLGVLLSAAVKNGVLWKEYRLKISNKSSLPLQVFIRIVGDGADGSAFFAARRKADQGQEFVNQALDPEETGVELFVDRTDLLERYTNAQEHRIINAANEVRLYVQCVDFELCGAVSSEPVLLADAQAPSFFEITGGNSSSLNIVRINDKK